MRELVNVAFVKDGSIIGFEASACYFMKVCDHNGHGGVVRLFGGTYYTYDELDFYGYGRQCFVVAENLDSFYYDDEENE